MGQETPDGTTPRWWNRWRRRWRGRSSPALDPDRPDLVVVASSFDDAEACSAALERAASTQPCWQASDSAVLRHHLLLPAAAMADATAVAEQDGYRRADPVELPEQVALAVSGSVEVPDGQVLVLRRVQVLDALHCSQERSRMAGLAQRRDGVALGWDALQPLSR